MGIFQWLLRRSCEAKRPQKYDKVLVSLKADEVQVLFVLLAEDGTVNRMGDGSLECRDSDLFIGQATEPLFERFMEAVDPAIFGSAGAYETREKTGKPCELQMVFGLRGSQASDGFWFRYGSESQGPPQEICDLVLRLVTLTNSWHAQQKALANKE